MNIFNDMFLNENNVISNDKDMYNPYEAYMRGNLYKNIYKPYKDYVPSKLIPNSEQAEMLLNINQIGFVNQDIRLYLDIYPNDRNMIKKYNDNVVLLDRLIKDYENKYGPLKCDSLSDDNLFSWATMSFPWEEVIK